MKPVSFRRASSLVVWLMMMTLATPIFLVRAQSGPTGTLTGTVADSTGAVVPGATITITSIATHATRTINADSEGRWKATALDVGVYKVTIEAQGFKKVILEQVEVEAAVPRTVEIKLEPGAVQEAVTITTGGTELIQRETATTFRQLNSLELQEVPSSTRSFTHLLSAEGGVSADLPPVLTNGTGNLSPSVNGLRTTSNSLQFNGIDTTNLTSNEGSLTDNISPAPETLQEVKLQTGLYDASTGRSGGGNFQLITKSGTNEFHGSVYYFHQNEKFNANDFFFNKDGIERPVARRHEGGFTIGGPVFKDRSFLFGSYQRTQALTGFVPTAQSISLLPVALNFAGDRSAASLVAAFKQANPAFNITPAQISRFALNLFNLRNPVTGGFVIPSPNSLPGQKGFLSPDGKPFLDAAGNPMVRVRQVFPAEFEQDQFTIRNDTQITDKNRLAATFFFSNFPGFDPFPDPSSLTSPFTLQRNDRARTFAVSDVHLIGDRMVNEARFGFFYLDNSRRGSDEFADITHDRLLEGTGVSITSFNPALLYDDSAATRRLSHFTFAPNFGTSFGYPNDSFNQREQQTFSVADILSYTRGAHTFRMGGEWKYHTYDTTLPEEQGTEFEKQQSYTQLLQGLTREADTQFGITSKQFRMTDVSFFFADDWKFSSKLTLNLGLRWDWFGWPIEKNGLIGNLDFSRVGPTLLPNAFIVPSNFNSTGIATIDESVALTEKADTKHTLNGQDLNNFQPRLGFAWSPFDSRKLVIRGGYGVFFDRPSAAFANTVFSNYPFLRELEVTFPGGRVPFLAAFSQQDPNLPFHRYLPNRLIFRSGNYEIRDGTPVIRGADGTINPNDPATGQPTRGNIAETFEFRAVDRDLRTPYVQQWGLGFQYEITKDFLVEARYIGTKGTKLLQALAFNQGYDLNDPSTPDSIFQRLNDAYVAAGSPRGPLRAGNTARERGTGVAFGFLNPLTGNIDLNLSQAVRLVNGVSDLATGTLIPFEARAPILGFNIPEALLLTSSANSIYNALQLGFQKRLSHGLQFNASYTFSKSIDTSSSDPGSTAGGGKPDVPNTGFVTQGDQRNSRANRALSDFDRTHRFSLSFVYDIPSFGSDSRWLKGWQIAGFVQAQSGTPFSIFASEPEAKTLADLLRLNLGSGGLYRLGFGRPSLVVGATLDDLRRQGADETEAFFNIDALASPLGGFGNLGRNVLRGPNQKRVDFSLSKTTKIVEDVALEFRWEIFNLFNNVNFANPNNDLNDTLDLGTISNTVGGPRVMQFGLKLKF